MHTSVSQRLIGTGLLTFSFACSADPSSLGLKDPPGREGQDAGEGLDTGTIPVLPPPCTLALSGPSRVSAGGRLALAFEATADAQVQLELPEGWRAKLDGSTAMIRVPNRAVGVLTLTAHARCAADQATSTLIVAVEPPAWRPIGDWSQSYAINPYMRQLASLFVDPEDSGSVFLYGGVSASAQGFVQELWAFDTEDDVWEMIPNIGMPGMSGGESLVMVPGEPSFLLTDAYSGWQGSGTPFSLFRVDYAGEGPGTSSLLVKGGPQSGSFGGAFVYVPHLDRYLLACGIGENGAHCDVALYDLERGEFEEPAITGAPPSGRYGFAYAYDEEEQRLILYSGGQDSAQGAVNPAQDTWALELATRPFRWSKLEIESPPGRRNSCFAFDPDGHRLFVWGGTPDARDVLDGLQVLELDRGFERWSRLDLPGTPPARSSGSSTFDRAGRRALFGFGNTSEEVFVDLHALEL